MDGPQQGQRMALLWWRPLREIVPFAPQLYPYLVPGMLYEPPPPPPPPYKHARQNTPPRTNLRDHFLENKGRGGGRAHKEQKSWLDPYRTAVPFGGQTTYRYYLQNLSVFSPKRDRNFCPKKASHGTAFLRRDTINASIH